MSPALEYLLGLAAALAVGLGVACYLKRHIGGILVDLCGSDKRADFWMAFSNVVLVLVPMVFALQFGTSPDEFPSPVLRLNNQLKWVFAGSAVSVMGLGAILARFIPRDAGGAKGSR